MVDNVIILAGGSGTRLWPASLNCYPKQFIKIKDDKSLLKLTIERAISLGISGEIIIITLKSQLADVLKECEPYADKAKLAVLPEPAARNTAPAITAAATRFKNSNQADSTMLILPADHLIEDLNAFKANTESADSLARSGFLVTYGIPPAYPETGYGYIKAGRQQGKGCKVDSFMEKPNLETAKQFLESGNYFWNSGMFVFKTDVFLREIKTCSPQVSSAFEKLDSALPDRFEKNIKIILDNESAAEVYKSSPSISIDYAVMEKTTCAAMVSADFFWNDIGSWDQFETIIKNFDFTDLFEVSSCNNMVFSDIPVALCGVEDLIVVIKNGKALICKKGLSQKVKDVRNIIEDKKRKDLL